jgi:hypothetical protein
VTENRPKPKRRWFQFSLRTLLVFVLLVSIGMSWFAARMTKARRQKKAVQAIERAGGMVSYDYQGDGPFGDPHAQPPVLKWARELLGDDFFCDVVMVAIVADKDFDDQASHLKALAGIKTLVLTGSQVTDAGLKHMEGLTKLERLSLGGSQVTGAGLGHLEGLTRLTAVGLNGTQVTDTGLSR